MYGILASLGILGLIAGLYPVYGLELFLGWILPVLAGIVTLHFICLLYTSDAADE